MRSSVEETGFYDMLKGVPQGAPTSCSLATLALRPLEEKVKESRVEDLVLYADDVIYFPEDANADPIERLENPKMGIKVNKEKSR